MSRPVLLDLFCGAGGCAMGYHRAGFDVAGVDHKPQPRYPFAMHEGDALEVLRNFLKGYDMYAANHYWQLRDFAVIHASPPCQAYSAAERIHGNGDIHPDLVGETRTLLELTGKTWVIENVPGAPLRKSIVICGTQLGLRVRRHRVFESNRFLFAPGNPCRHSDGDITVFGDSAQVCGTFGKPYQDKTGRTHWRKKRIAVKSEGGRAMGIDWMSGRELSQAIPPAYTEFIGRQLREVIG